VFWHEYSTAEGTVVAMQQMWLTLGDTKGEFSLIWGHKYISLKTAMKK